MNRQEFIDTLSRSLYGQIDTFTLQGHIRYYEEYIAEETAKGRSEKEVLEELGDPRLIARTILDTAGVKPPHAEYMVMDEPFSDERQKIHVHYLTGWRSAVFTAAVVLIMLMIFFVVFRLAVLLLPVLIVIGIAGWLARKIFY